MYIFTFFTQNFEIIDWKNIGEWIFSRVSLVFLNVIEPCIPKIYCVRRRKLIVRIIIKWVTRGLNLIWLDEEMAQAWILLPEIKVRVFYIRIHYNLSIIIKFKYTSKHFIISKINVIYQEKRLQKIGWYLLNPESIIVPLLPITG